MSACANILVVSWSKWHCTQAMLCKILKELLGSLLIWVVCLSSTSRNMPRFFTAGTLWMMSSSILIEMLPTFISYCDNPRIMNLVLFSLSFRKFVCIQWWTASRQFSSLVMHSIWLFRDPDIGQKLNSGYYQHILEKTLHGPYISHPVGPQTDWTGWAQDWSLVVFLVRVAFLRTLLYHNLHFGLLHIGSSLWDSFSTMIGLDHKLHSLLRSKWWLTMSNAALKSSITRHITSFLSMASSMSVFTFNRAVSVEKFSWYSNWQSSIWPVELLYCTICLQASLSMIIPKYERFENRSKVFKQEFQAGMFMKRIQKSIL